jgi:VRR-NUC domain
MAKTALQRDLFAAPKRIRLPRHEDREQMALVQWFRLAYPRQSDYLLHVPNGGLRGKREAGRLKAMGVSAGFPDLLLLLPSGHYHGLAVEMKPTGSTWCSVRTEQRLWLARLAGQGYRAEVAYGFDQGREILENYVSGKMGRESG